MDVLTSVKYFVLGNAMSQIDVSNRAVEMENWIDLNIVMMGIIKMVIPVHIIV